MTNVFQPVLVAKAVSVGEGEYNISEKIGSAVRTKNDEDEDNDYN